MTAAPWPIAPQLRGLTKTQRLHAVFADTRIDLVIDVGANAGQFVAELRAFYTGDVISFEPYSTAYAELARVASGDSTWRTMRAALGDCDGEAVLHTSTSSDFSSLLPTNTYCAKRFGTEAASSGRQTVPLQRLDSALDAMHVDWRDRRLFLKLDTQGYDLQVFRGLGNVVHCVSAMLSEVALIPLYQGMPTWRDAIGEYEHAGFGVVDLWPVTRDGHHVIEYDCLLMRRSAPVAHADGGCQ